MLGEAYGGGSGRLRVAAASLGCKVNSYDTQAMLGMFAAKGHEIVSFDEAADVYIINTCAVTNVGGKKSRQMIRRAASTGAVVVACGCYAQVSPEGVSSIPGVDLVLGAAGRAGIVDAVETAVSQGQRKPKLDMPDIVNEKVYEPIALGDFDSGERVRAFLKIQDGCDNFCSYCIIPYARGPQRSRGLDDALNEARLLAAKGFKEIVLTGIHVTSYGQDHKNSDLTGLMRRLHEIAGIERIRLGSMDPVSINIPFLEALKEMPKVCRHFHMSLQSGCDKTLKRMNRRYTSQFYREAVAMARGLFPLASFTTDMIAGFPGETEDDFNQSLEFAREMGFAKIHAFPYSKVAGTPAAGFPGQLQRAEKARRALKLIELGEETGRAYRSMFLGKRIKVLFEREASPGIWDGLADNYMRVRAPFKEDAANRLLEVEMHSLQEGFAIGGICEDSLQ